MQCIIWILLKKNSNPGKKNVRNDFWIKFFIIADENSFHLSIVQPNIMPIKFQIFKIIIILGSIIFYFIYTFNFYNNLKHNVLFSKRIKLFHKVAIWVIPFIWILMIKGFTMRTFGSHEISKKTEDEPWSSAYNNA